MKSTIRGFKPLSELPPFKDRFFIVTSVSFGDHAAIFYVGGGVEGRWVDLFSKYWTVGHFLLINHFFMYNEKDITDEAQFQKGRLVKFISNLGYVRSFPSAGG